MEKFIGFYETEMLATEILHKVQMVYKDIYLRDKELGNTLTKPAILTG